MKHNLLILAFFISSASFASPPAIHWMSFTEAVALSKKQPKKIFIDVYARWCGNCKHMDASTFQDSALAVYMNEHFYPVKLDAETHDSIPFRDHVFTYDAAKKANELAITLLGGDLAYPNFVLLDEEFNLVTNISGYQTIEQLSPALRYFSEDRFKTQTFDEYMKGTSSK